MKKITVVLVLLSLFAAAGCMQSLKITKQYQRSPNDSFQHTILVKDSIKVPDETVANLSAKLDGLLVRWNKLAKGATANSKQIEITISNYSMRSDGSRFWLGALAGTDKIETTVIVRSSDGSQVLADFNVVTENQTAVGSSDELLHDHAAQIVRYLVEGKDKTNLFIKQD